MTAGSAPSAASEHRDGEGRALPFDHRAVEAKWRAAWEADRTADVSNGDVSVDRPGMYVLEMLPYPSGRLHMGHVKNYTMGDVITHFRRRSGNTVLHPMGYDSFGLPAENAAIKTGGHPLDVTERNIGSIEEDFAHMGWSIDWTRKLATHAPDYYRWTQWLFLKFREQGLAYQKDAPVNWCPVDQTVLANEQVVDGHCDRCGSLVEKRSLNQWYFKITQYAQRLLDDMEILENWPERVLTMQRNWIGRSEGAHVKFACAALGDGEAIEVFTTRPDTLHGATFFVIAPEHPLLDQLIAGTDREAAVRTYVAESAKLSNIDRSATDRPKTGVDTGRTVTNPVNGREIPLWVADYVLPDYGSGALMAVPGHDERDCAFAQAHGIAIERVIASAPGAEDELPYTPKQGVLVNSGDATGMSVADGARAIVDGLGGDIAEFTINYRLRDWLISRQRYWGCPIPIIHCDECGAVPVPAEELPVILPDVEDYAPKGKSPLAAAEEWVNTRCPNCSSPAKRETDTMDTFVDSSWYYLRYADPHNQHEPFNRDVVDSWLPVDQYIGGVEHAVLHLLYARFFTKVLYDLDMVGFQEPFANLFTQGMINYEGTKMSKSKGNLVEPLPYVEKYGADALRTYILFLGPPEQDADWQDTGIEGTRRFLDRLWRLAHAVLAVPGASSGIVEWPSAEEVASDEIARQLAAASHAAIAKVSEDIDPRFQFNTAISALMELVNTGTKLIAGERDALQGDVPAVRIQAARAMVQTAASLTQPFAPHITSEIWSLLGGESLVTVPWPVADDAYLVQDTITIAVQVSGKLRGTIEVAPDASKEDILAAARADANVASHLENTRTVKEIVVPGRLVNLVVAPA